MLKSWATWPPSIRWAVAGIAAAVLALAIAWVLFVPAADWLAHHDVGSSTGSLHEAALDHARGRLLTLGAGLLAAGALWFTARNFTLSRRTFSLAEQGQVTDRYTKAIEQLGSEKVDVRIGGIYALELVARDSGRDHPTVIEVLCTFIREHSPGAQPFEEPGSYLSSKPAPDVQAALTVIGRRDPRHDLRPIDLSGLNLARAHFVGANLVRASFDGTCLAGADFTNANLSYAWLSGATLAGAHLHHASLDHAELGADLRNAGLWRATLTHAHCENADFTYADDVPFVIRGDMVPVGSEPTDLDILRMNLGSANLAGAELAGAKWPEDVRAPEGWRRDDFSGRLRRVDAARPTTN